MVPNPEQTPTVSVEMAAKLLGLSRNSGYEAARTGQLPVLRFGRRLVVPVAALRSMLGLAPTNEHRSPPLDGA